MSSGLIFVGFVYYARAFCIGFVYNFACVALRAGERVCYCAFFALVFLYCLLKPRIQRFLLAKLGLQFLYGRFKFLFFPNMLISSLYIYGCLLC